MTVLVSVVVLENLFKKCLYKRNLADKSEASKTSWSQELQPRVDLRELSSFSHLSIPQVIDPQKLTTATITNYNFTRVFTTLRKSVRPLFLFLSIYLSTHLSLSPFPSLVPSLWATPQDSLAVATTATF